MLISNASLAPTRENFSATHAISLKAKTEGASRKFAFLHKNLPPFLWSVSPVYFCVDCKEKLLASEGIVWARLQINVFAFFSASLALLLYKLIASQQRTSLLSASFCRFSSPFRFFHLLWLRNICRQFVQGQMEIRRVIRAPFAT